MVTDKIKLDTVVTPSTGGHTTSAGFISTLLMTSIILFVLAFIPFVVQADGLFDFQMKLASKGNAEAEFKVGEMYETGFGVKVDKAEAMTWITKAANQGHETASFKLLYWDVEKNGFNAANKAKVDDLKAKAKAGNSQAEYYIGKMYARGVGMKKDSDKAIKWLNKAALVGVLEAERELTNVRENSRNDALAKRRADEKRHTDLKASQEKEGLAKQEKQRKLQGQKKSEAKVRSDETARKNKAAAKSRAKAAEKSKLLAQKEVAVADVRRREAEKQALIKKRAAEKKTRKIEFESDPCSGKSARFLSTCR